MLSEAYNVPHTAANATQFGWIGFGIRKSPITCNKLCMLNFSLVRNFCPDRQNLSPVFLGNVNKNEKHRPRSRIFCLISTYWAGFFCLVMVKLAVFPGRGGGYSHIVWVGCAAGFVKVLPFTRLNFANFVTLYQRKNALSFFISIFCEQSN